MQKPIQTACLLLLCFVNSNAAQAAAGPLDGIDSRLVAEHFPLDAGIAVEPQATDTRRIPGCSQVKSFDIFEGNVPEEIVVAICQDGEFSPRNIEATIARQVADARESVKNMPPQVSQYMLAGADPMTVALADGRTGKALTLPAVGHGFALVPFAYAVTAQADATVVIQAFLDPNKPRNLTKPVAALLQGIDQRLRTKTQ